MRARVPLVLLVLATALVPAVASAQRSSQEAGKRVGTLAGPAGDGSPLAGAPAGEVREVLRAATHRVRSCYERAARLAPDLAGTLTVVLVVGDDGAVLEASVEDDGVGSDVLSRCVVAVAGELHFPSPTPAPATLRWPIDVPLAPGAAPAAPDLPERERFVPEDRGDGGVAFWTYLGTGSLIGALPAALAGLLLALPFGVLAAPLFAIVPLVGNYVAVFVAQIFSGVEAPAFFYILPALLAVALYPALYAVAAVPVVDQLGRGAAFPLDTPALSWPGAATLAVGLLLVGETLTLTSAAMYSAAADEE
jgi:hypothetical protein